MGSRRQLLGFNVGGVFDLVLAHGQVLYFSAMRRGIKPLLVEEARVKIDAFLGHSFSRLDTIFSLPLLICRKI